VDHAGHKRGKDCFDVGARGGEAEGCPVLWGEDGYGRILCSWGMSDEESLS
jgi:hypothetical protein